MFLPVRTTLRKSIAAIRRSRLVRRSIYAGVAVLVFVALEGCFYIQAIGGQMEVLRKRRPLDEVIADQATNDELRKKLVIVQEVHLRGAAPGEELEAQNLNRSFRGVLHL